MLKLYKVHIDPDAKLLVPDLLLCCTLAKNKTPQCLAAALRHGHDMALDLARKAKHFELLSSPGRRKVLRGPSIAGLWPVLNIVCFAGGLGGAATKK